MDRNDNKKHKEREDVFNLSETNNPELNSTRKMP
jgi:hypothetical protein